MLIVSCIYAYISFYIPKRKGVNFMNIFWMAKKKTVIFHILSEITRDFIFYKQNIHSNQIMYTHLKNIEFNP